MKSRGNSSVGRAPVLHAGCPGFDSPFLHHYLDVAQLVAHLPWEQGAEGSSPSIQTTAYEYAFRELSKEGELQL